MKFYFSLLAVVLIIFSGNAFASKPIRLEHQPISILQDVVVNKVPLRYSVAPMLSIEEISRELDANKTTHIRIHETYKGYPVWGSDAVIHIQKNNGISSLNQVIHSKTNNVTMNGQIYQGLEADLLDSPSSVFDDELANKTLQQFIQFYLKEGNVITHKKIKLMVYRHNGKSRWVYLISFHVANKNTMPKIPTFIVDAATAAVYSQWNNIRTFEAQGGGYGGNEKIGKIIYDGQKDHAPALKIERNPIRNICYLKNSEVLVKDMRFPLFQSRIDDYAVIEFPCNQPDPTNPLLFWNHKEDAINGAFSPANDALAFGNIIYAMYHDWYGIPVLQKNGQSQVLVMRVHDQSRNFSTNAYWDPELEVMTFGDGGEVRDRNHAYQFTFFPLVSLGIAAHEISHGFTSQYANFNYFSQSGGLDESFSDMAAIAAKFYYTGHVKWQLGSSIIKEDLNFRYLDEPTKDCSVGSLKSNGLCSIDHLSAYYKNFDSWNLYLIPNTKIFRKERSYIKNKAVVLVGEDDTKTIHYLIRGLEMMGNTPVQITLQSDDKKILISGLHGLVNKTSENAVRISELYQELDQTGDNELSLDPHFSSGIFNKAYYLISTAKGWDPKKAFDIMVQANRYYWTANTTFEEAACGVIKASQDLKYDLSAVSSAMSQVGIEVMHC